MWKLKWEQGSNSLKSRRQTLRLLASEIKPFQRSSSYCTQNQNQNLTCGLLEALWADIISFFSIWVIKYHCGTSIPGDAQSSAGPGTAQPHVGGPHRCPSGLAIFGIWGLLWYMIMCYLHRPPPQKHLQHPLLFSSNATTIGVTAFIYLRDCLAFCQRCTQYYCYYIIWGGWGLKLIYLDLSEPAEEFKLFTKTPRPLKATGSSRI